MERFYWIELIGFDNEAQDFGVEAFISRTVSISGVSLLFSHLDFLFDEENDTLPPRACSYFGHEYSRERQRQIWTKKKLCGLVRELKSRGIKVFFSCFDMISEIKDPSLVCYNANGAPEKLIYVIKKLPDGRRVGDILIPLIKKALDEYGFDGLQLADGLSSNRLSIENGDFSLPLCLDSGIDIPKELLSEGEASYAKRRDFILKNKRYEWTKYISDSWAEFYDKLFREIKKPIMFNNAWTRDSFEAFYRYGLDYRRCHANEAYAVMIEENSATRAITSAKDEGGVEFSLSERSRFTYEYALMQENIKIFTDGLKQISLTPISDTLEGWDAIRHCPTELSRSIMRRYNSFVYREGKFEVVCDAPLYCLSDGIDSSDWRWLAKQESFRIPSPDSVAGFCAVINPDGLDSEVKDFCENKNYFGSALLSELTMAGLNLGASIPLSEVGSFTSAKCLLVTDLKSYSEESKRRLTEAKLPILIVGEDTSLPLPLSAKYEGEYISASLYGYKGEAPHLDEPKEYERIIEKGEPSHGEIWTEPLSYKRVSSEFFAKLSKILNEAFRLDYAAECEVKVTSYLSKGEKHLFLSNDAPLYTIANIHTDGIVKYAEVTTEYKGYPVRLKDDILTVRIPPKSSIIVRITE